MLHRKCYVNQEITLKHMERAALIFKRARSRTFATIPMELSSTSSALHMFLLRALKKSVRLDPWRGRVFNFRELESVALNSDLANSVFRSSGRFTFEYGIQRIVVCIWRKQCASINALILVQLMRTFQRSCRVSRASKRSSRLSLTLIERPSGRYYALHPKVGLRWVNYSNISTSFRICHMVQRSLTNILYVVHNYVGRWLDLIRNLSYGPMAIILRLSSGEKEVY
jgi:hypothetical protein